MIQTAIFCPLIKKESKTVVVSPTVGLVKLRVFEGQLISKGQIIFELWRLNHCFIAEWPEPRPGRVMAILQGHSFYVGFHDLVLELNHEELSLSDNSTKQKISTEGLPILSPMDGMFYLSPSPSDPPFVTVGDKIMPGQTIGLIEVMKSFYPVKYQGITPTTLIHIYLPTASAVVSGEKLFTVAC